MFVYFIVLIHCFPEKSKKKDNTYLVTDLDRSVTVDLGTGAPFLMSPKSESKYNQYIQPTKVSF